VAKRALIIANSEYDDDHFATLPAATADAAALKEVLGDPDIGGFEVDPLIDAEQRSALRALESFFTQAKPDDLLLLHLSLHGWKDLHNRLHFVMRDTERDYPGATAVSAEVVGDWMGKSSCRSIVVLLDCCYSGAFPMNARRRDGGTPTVDIGGPFSARPAGRGGKGRVVLTASTALQYAYEDEGERDVRYSRTPAEPSVFTSAVVRGLRDGAADLDGDGLVSVNELYDYVHEQVRQRIAGQTPTLSVDSAQGTIYVARSPRHGARARRPSRPEGRRPDATGLPIVGIDFGTTNSAIGVFESEDVCLIPNAEGALTTPSLVAVTAEGKILVGTAAKRQAITNPDYTVRSVKLKLGTDWSIARGAVRLTAEEVARVILARLREDAEAYLGGQLGAAVLTVPATFGLDQRAALVRAGEEAGLHIRRMVNEPTAAAMTYGLNREDDSTVLIFDLGGGTLDVSLIDISDGVVDVKATAGDNHLGGDDWDLRIVQHVIDRVRRQYGVDLANDVAAMQRLREAAEAAKIELSAASASSLLLPYLATGPHGPLHLDEVLTREEFETLTRDLLERCRRPIEQAVSDAGLALSDIGRVILTGGATRMPAVGELVRRLTGGRGLYRGLIPEGVVTGAALQAGVLSGAIKDMLLLDACSASIGVEVQGQTVRKLIERNTTIPTKRSEYFTTHTDNQPTAVLHFVEGEEDKPTRNRTLSVLELALPPAPRGVPQIEVTAALDANGVLHVMAKNLGNGNEATNIASHATMEKAAALVRSPRWTDLRSLTPLSRLAERTQRKERAQEQLRTRSRKRGRQLLTQAEEVSRQISGMGTRAQTLAHLAAAVLPVDEGRAGRLMGEAEQCARSVPQRLEQVRALAMVVAELAPADRRRARTLAGQAETLAWGIGSREIQWRALLAAAKGMASVDPDRAEQIVRDLGDVVRQDVALYAIAEAMAPTDPDRAERIARDLSDARRKWWLLRHVAEALAVTDPDRAESVARSIGDREERLRALRQVVTALAEVAPERAEQAAHSLPTEEERAQALRDVFRWLLHANPGRAELLARSMTDEDGRWRRLGDVVEVLAVTDPDGAESVARSILDEERQASALYHVFHAMRAVDPRRAQQIARDIPASQGKVRAKVLVATAENLAGTDPHRARQLVQEAAQIAQQIADPEDRVSALLSMAEMLMDTAPDRAAEFLAECEQVARAVPDPEKRLELLEEIVSVVVGVDPQRAARTAMEAVHIRAENQRWYLAWLADTLVDHVPDSAARIAVEAVHAGRRHRRGHDGDDYWSKDALVTLAMVDARRAAHLATDTEFVAKAKASIVLEELVRDMVTRAGWALKKAEKAVA
jgi:molecular chaperone DnaK (HSP70)